MPYDADAHKIISLVKKHIDEMKKDCLTSLFTEQTIKMVKCAVSFNDKIITFFRSVIE